MAPSLSSVLLLWAGTSARSWAGLARGPSLTDRGLKLALPFLGSLSPVPAVWAKWGTVRRADPQAFAWADVMAGVLSPRNREAAAGQAVSAGRCSAGENRGGGHTGSRSLFLLTGSY